MVKTRARSCTGKKQQTKAQAWEMYYSLRRKGASMLHVYNCKFCKAFHVGHKPKPRKRR